jgi:predicted RNA-binding Zn ribbon-like protein
MRHSEAITFSDDRDGFRFRGGSAAIDLAATLQARLTPAPRELLAVPGDLDRWFASASLPCALGSATAKDLHTARALREAIFQLAGQLGVSGLDAAPLRVLNGVAALAPATPELKPSGRAELKGSAAQLLSSLAREAVQLFGGPVARQVRQCQAPACTIYFVDTSRAGDRRWCSMSACGNKAKVAEFRRRNGTASKR